MPSTITGAVMRWLVLLALSCTFVAVHGVGTCTIQLPIYDFLCPIVCTAYGVNGDTQDPGVAAGSYVSSIYPTYSGVCTRWQLKIADSLFPNNVLKPNWLVGSSLPAFETLILHTVGLQLIQPGALDGPQFGANLKGLAVYNNQALNYLDATITQGLTSLGTFEWVGNGQLIYVEADTFQPFVTTIEVFTVNDCDIATSEVMANVTGICQTSGDLPNLRSVDLSFNSGPGLNVLSSRHFNRLTAILSLYIKTSDVGYFENKDVLNPIANTLQKLDLSGNNLKTLPTGSLDSIIADNKESFALALQGNPWHCDCNLEWLQTIIRTGQGNVVLSDEPRCASPASENQKLLIEANMQAACDPIPAVPPFDVDCVTV